MTVKTKKIIGKTLSVAWWSVFIALFALIIGIISAKAKGEVPSVFGYSVVKVITPSMGEKIPVGTYVIIREVDPADVNEEDIICFYSDDPSIKGLPNLHRVVRPIQVGDKYEYITKGDGNASEDSVTAKSDKLIGKYVKSMDLLTSIANDENSQGMMTFVAVLFVLSLGMIVAVAVIATKNEAEK